MVDYIKSFYTSDYFELEKVMVVPFIGRNDSIYVNAIEPIWMYLPWFDTIEIIDFYIGTDGVLTFIYEMEYDDSVLTQYVLKYMYDTFSLKYENGSWRICDDYINSDLKGFHPDFGKSIAP